MKKGQHQANGPMEKNAVPISRRKVSDIFDSLTKTGLKLLELSSRSNWKNKRLGLKEWKEYYPKRLVKLMSPTIIFMARKP